MIGLLRDAAYAIAVFLVLAVSPFAESGVAADEKAHESDSEEARDFIDSLVKERGFRIVDCTKAEASEACAAFNKTILGGAIDQKPRLGEIGTFFPNKDLSTNGARPSNAAKAMSALQGRAERIDRTRRGEIVNLFLRSSQSKSAPRFWSEGRGVDRFPHPGLSAEPIAASPAVVTPNMFVFDGSEADDEGDISVIEAVEGGVGVSTLLRVRAAQQIRLAKKKNCEFPESKQSLFLQALAANRPYFLEGTSNTSAPCYKALGPSGVGTQVGGQGAVALAAIQVAEEDNDWSKVIYGDPGFASTIRISSKGPGVKFCSGVLVDGRSEAAGGAQVRFILTARHCVCGIESDICEGSVANAGASLLCDDRSEHSCESFGLIGTLKGLGSSSGDGASVYQSRNAKSAVPPPLELKPDAIWIDTRVACQESPAACLDMAILRVASEDTKRLIDAEKKHSWGPLHEKISLDSPTGEGGAFTIAGFGVTDDATDGWKRTVGWINSSYAQTEGGTELASVIDFRKDDVSKPEPRTIPCAGDSGQPIYDSVSMGFECVKSDGSFHAPCNFNSHRKRRVVGVVSALKVAKEARTKEACRNAQQAQAIWFNDKRVATLLTDACILDC